MKLGVVSGPRYYRMGQQYYTTTSYHVDMWKECLEVFDEVIIADQVIHTKEVKPGCKRVLTEGVRFIDFPNAKGLLSLLKAFPAMFLRARKVVKQADVWHLHGPNIVSICVWFWLRIYNIPYSEEQRGEQGMNPEYLKLRGIRFAKVVALAGRIALKFQYARSLLYIGLSKHLVDKYRPKSGCPAYIISDNRIPSDVYRTARVWSETQENRTIASVGNVEVVKNPSGLLRACALLNKKMPNWKLIWMGRGPLLEDMRKLAAELGIAEKVEFCGFVPWGPQLFEKLYASDLFVLNSLSEGMPRAMLEAMACALPVIGTNVGGIPELLEEEDIVPVLRYDCLADKLYEVLTNPKRLTEMSKRNAEKAKEYSAEVLSNRKIEFYKLLRQLVEKGKSQSDS